MTFNTLIEQGVNYFRSGQHKEAVETLLEAVKANPNRADAYFHLGDVYQEVGDYEKAMKYYLRAIHLKACTLEPNNSLIDGTDGHRIPLSQIQTPADNAVINSERAEGYFHLGVAFGKIGDFAKALFALQQAVLINPNFAQAHFAMGIVYNELGDTAKTIESYQKAISIDEGHAETHYNLGITYLNCNELDKAMEHYRTLETINPSLAQRLLSFINNESA